MENSVSVANPLSRLFAFIKPYWPRLSIGVGYSFFNKLLDLAPPVLVGWAVDTVTRKPPYFFKWLSGGDIYLSVALLGVLGILIFGFESLFQWLLSRQFLDLSQDVQHDLRMATYKATQKRELEFFENHRLGDTMAIMGDDINQLERFLNTVFNDIVQLVSLFIIASFILLSTSWSLSLITIIPLPIIVWGALFFQKLILPRYKNLRFAVGKLNSRLENNISGISVIKSFTAESYEAERFEQSSNEYRAANLHAIRLSTLFTPLIRMGVAVSFAGVLWIGGRWVIEGSLTAGSYTLFAMMCQRILWPMTRMGQLLDETERCRASAARIFNLLDTPARIKDSNDAIDVKAIGTKSVIFEDVGFSYQTGLTVVKNLSFAIKAGENIGIAGATGSGKSTLVKLLLRFYEPLHGRISIDGIDIKQMTMSQLRKGISLVSQDTYIFHGTIAENITYGQREVCNESMVEAAKSAQLHDYIMSLPDGYHTLVGERGVKLSGGQRQRLSIARALLKNAPILVLDEATSAVDTETERAVQENLDQFTSGRTAIIIAHRLSTIRYADRILVLKNGDITEQGSHDELIAKGGVYADLWRLQTGQR